VARQGHRIWSARLAIVITLALGLVWFAGARIWHRMASDDAASLPGKAVEPIQAEPRVSELVEDPHALDPVLELARDALEQHTRVHRDYTATLVKRERINGVLQPESKMEMKLRYNPPAEDALSNGGFLPREVSVYLKTIEPKSQAGREVIWVQGANGNKLFAHEAGLLGLVTVQLAPTSRLAMIGNRYPITEIGLHKLLEKLIERGVKDRAIGPAIVKQTSQTKVGDITCSLIEVIHEQPFEFVGGKRVEFEFYMARIYFDDARLVPIKYASFTWPKRPGDEPELEEEYIYENLQLNVGLSDEDFDTKNPRYQFPN
jgi:hypothetical protein